MTGKYLKYYDAHQSSTITEIQASIYPLDINFLVEVIDIIFMFRKL